MSLLRRLQQLEREADSEPVSTRKRDTLTPKMREWQKRLHLPLSPEALAIYRDDCLERLQELQTILAESTGDTAKQEESIAEFTDWIDEIQAEFA